ncbi:hypothetical protein EDD92_8298 [Streptomyces sp. TLI_185]|nr:hypothetical protein EDD92_8298 [Streptomyces sp. TLI_185]
MLSRAEVRRRWPDWNAPVRLTCRQIEELKAWALEWAEDLGARIHDENA